MPHRTTRTALAALALLVAFASSSSRAQSTQAVTAGSYDDFSGQSFFLPSISADGQVVAFYAENPREGLGCELFVHDRSSLRTEQVTVDPQGRPAQSANCALEEASLSADGSLISFVSSAPNLVVSGWVASGWVVDGWVAEDWVADDSDSSAGIFIRDLSARRTERVRLDSLFAEPDDIPVRLPSLSGDGRLLAFEAFTPRAGSRVLLLDRDTGALRDVGLERDGQPIQSSDPSISTDGRFIRFFADAIDEESGTPRRAVYVRDLRDGGAQIASRGPDGRLANAVRSASISADGRRLLFVSAEPTQGGELALGVFVRDLVSGTTRPIELDRIGGSPRLTDAELSGNGRFALLEVTRFSAAADVFVVDLATGEPQPVNLDHEGRLSSGRGRSPGASISRDGGQVAFVSDSPGLAARDLDLLNDVFVRELRPAVERSAEHELRSLFGAGWAFGGDFREHRRAR